MQPVPAAMSNLVVMPPLEPAQWSAALSAGPAAAANEVQISEPPAPLAVDPVIEEPVVIQAGGNIFDAAVPNAMTIPQKHLLTPQMLIPYFRDLDRSTTNSTGSIVAPVTFVPPAPVVLPSSKAVYTVTPPAKAPSTPPLPN
jgi:hypothetical protein